MGNQIGHNKIFDKTRKQNFNHFYVQVRIKNLKMFPYSVKNGGSVYKHLNCVNYSCKDYQSNLGAKQTCSYGQRSQGVLFWRRSLPLFPIRQWNKTIIE